MNTAQATEAEVDVLALATNEELEETVKEFDFDELDTVDYGSITHRVAVREDSEGNPISGFIIVGKNSPQYLTVTGNVRTANIQRSAKRGRAIETATKEGAALVSKTVVANDKAIALAVVVDWFGMTKGGKPMEFSKEAVLRAFQKLPTWQNKVLAALEVDANFTKV